jgi:hypothetical protein
LSVLTASLAAAGLEDQLLGKLILKEKHELEEQRQQLLEEVQSYKKKIKQLEDDLLFRWASLLCMHSQSFSQEAIWLCRCSHMTRGRQRALRLGCIAL